MKTTNPQSMSVTTRQIINFLNVLNEFNKVIDFDFRCNIAAITIEARRRLQVFNEAQLPSPGIVSFNKELSLHKENCTIDVEGAKQIDTESYMVLYEQSKIKYAKDIAEANKLQQEANRALDKEIDLDVKPIPMETLRVIDSEAQFSPDLLSFILPFCSDGRA